MVITVAVFRISITVIIIIMIMIRLFILLFSVDFSTYYVNMKCIYCNLLHPSFDRLQYPFIYFKVLKVQYHFVSGLACDPSTTCKYWTYCHGQKRSFEIPQSIRLAVRILMPIVQTFVEQLNFWEKK